MKLQDIFDQLTAGEFSQLSIGGEDAGVINPNNYKRVLAHINLGLTALYRRFTLKEGRIVLNLQPGLSTYMLNSDYAEMNRRSRQPLRYIQDSLAVPFKDDILKVEKVLTGGGFELGLNDEGDPLACFTPNMTTLVVPDFLPNPTSETPKWLQTTYLTVVYRANHSIIEVTPGLFDPSRVTIELPYSYLEALLLFVASRVQSPVGLSNEFNAATRYAQLYEAACAELEAKNLRVDHVAANYRLHQKGFV